MNGDQIQTAINHFAEREKKLQSLAIDWQNKSPDGRLNKFQYATIKSGQDDLAVFASLLEIIKKQRADIMGICPMYDLLQNPKYKRLLDVPADYRDTILQSIYLSYANYFHSIEYDTKRTSMNGIYEMRNDARVAIFLSCVIDEIKKFGIISGYDKTHEDFRQRRPEFFEHPNSNILSKEF